MADRANQHFVPQFYFRRFSSGKPWINVLLMQNGKTIPKVPIKGQCARHKFYGSNEIESLFSEMEGRHAETLNNLHELAWSPAPRTLTPETLYYLWQAIVFQRSRTQLTINKLASGMEPMFLEMFKQYLEHAKGIEDRERLVKLIEEGHFQLNCNPQDTVRLSIGIALEIVLLISDLDIRILRNLTDIPFIFSDSPVIFYNAYCRHINNRGVLGFQSPGLQIFYPLDPDTMIMLFDEKVYNGPYKETLKYDLLDKADIWQLNALQAFHSLNAIYYASENNREYVKQLWKSVKGHIVPVKSVFKKRDDCYVDGKPVLNLLHTYEKQLNIDLDLSFIKCDPIHPSEYKFHKRDPGLCQFVEEMRNKKA